MKIVIIGGSGLTGTKLVQKLRLHRHEVIAASPSSGVNSVTGAGLDATLTGAEVVIDVTNSRSFEEESIMKFFETSTRNLLAAETAAGVRQHIILSVVGADRMPGSGYMRAKVAQENLVRTSKRSFTILRATQYFEFLGTIANVSTDQGTVRLPPVFVQPVAVDDVVDVLTELAAAIPVNNTIELAGPERFRFDELIQEYLNGIQDPRKVIADSDARYFGAQLHEDTLLPNPHPRIDSIHFAQWLDRNSAS